MSIESPRVTFWGGVGFVTGANFLLETQSSSILVDCGMLQGVPGADVENAKDFPYDPANMHFLFITHAHIDHIGRVAKLYKDGFRGVIYSTLETRSLSELMLQDAARIMDTNARETGVLPMYSLSDVKGALSLWKTIPYHEQIEVSEGVSVELFDAGHILGSAMYCFALDSKEGSKKKILFTGDLGNSPSLLLENTEYVRDVDYIVMDSVYGDRNHESKEEREQKFKKVLLEAIHKKGTVIIPAFSLERTQTILYEINNLVEDKHIPSVPVFLDSPLAIELTKIYEHISSLYNRDVERDIAGGDKIFQFPKLKATAHVEDSKQIAYAPDPKVIIAGSGMSTAGRVLHHEARYLPDPHSTLLLMGYQAPGSLGRQLQEGQKKVMIHDEEVTVKANIITIDGYSAHKDMDNLVGFIDQSNSQKLKKVFVVLGEPRSSLFLSQRLRDYLGVNALVPERGVSYPL